jgi:hypothetical protein
MNNKRISGSRSRNLSLDGKLGHIPWLNIFPENGTAFFTAFLVQSCSTLKKICKNEKTHICKYIRIFYSYVLRSQNHHSIFNSYQDFILLPRHNSNIKLCVLSLFGKNLLVLFHQAQAKFFSIGSAKNRRSRQCVLN